MVGSLSAAAAPISPAICALCPQAWAACVSGFSMGWPATTSASNSPISASVGPGLPVSMRAFTPVRASPAR